MIGTLFSDGGARPTNPGYAAFGCIVQTPENTHKISRFIGFRTNNEAEFFGMIVGVKYAYFLGVRELHACSDSKLVVMTIIGDWQPKNENIKRLCQEARENLRKYFPECHSLEYVPRSENTEADALCTAAIHYGRNKNPFTPDWIKEKRPVGEEIDPFKKVDGSKFPPNPSAAHPALP